MRRPVGRRTPLLPGVAGAYWRLRSHSCPTMPPAIAPPAAPARLPLVTAEPATPPRAAPVAVCCSCFDMCPHPASAATASAAASENPIRVFIPVSLDVRKWPRALLSDAVPFVSDRAAGDRAADRAERAAAAEDVTRDRAAGSAD